MFNEEQKDYVFKNYIAECLKAICENTCVPANYYSNGKTGSYFKKSYSEIIKPTKTEDVDPEKVIERIKSKFRG